METNSIQVDQELDDPPSMEPPTDLPSATDLDYDLPQERIAIRPIEPRSSSCLLVSDASSQESGKILRSDLFMVASCWGHMYRPNRFVVHSRFLILTSQMPMALQSVIVSFDIYLHYYHPMHYW